MPPYAPLARKGFDLNLTTELLKTGTTLYGVYTLIYEPVKTRFLLAFHNFSTILRLNCS